MIREVLFAVLCLTAAHTDAQELIVPPSLSLEEALRLATQRNPTLSAARNVVEIAEARRIDARLRPNPALTFESAAYPLFDSPRPAFGNNQELTFRLDQEIELAGRRNLRTQAAETGVAAAESTFQDQKRRLEFEVQRAYFAVVLAKADLEVAGATLAEIDKVIDLNRARYEQGEIAGSELRRIQVERLTFVDDQFNAELALRSGAVYWRFSPRATSPRSSTSSKRSMRRAARARPRQGRRRRSIHHLRRSGRGWSEAD